jgi:molecular chaperone DnaK (HSP70)
LLLEACREKKEALHPNTRRIEVDFEAAIGEGAKVTIAVNDYYDRAWPLVQETLHATDDMLAQHCALDAVEALYITGGGSELPLVSRVLKEHYGRKVKRSAYMRAATAIGLAIHADQESGYTLRERFHQYFGVWREADQGRRIIFDPIFTKGTELPAAKKPALVVTRAYRPMHNVGHFRFLESTRIAHDHQPAGEITYWDEILFPFDPHLESVPNLAGIPVNHSFHAQKCDIREVYRCDSNGRVSVEITNRTSGYSQVYPLARWGRQAEPVAAEGTTKRRKAKSKKASTA